MILVIRELKTDLTQDFEMSLRKRRMVKQVSVYLVNFNSPSGTFTLEIEKDSQVIFSGSFTSQDIKDQLNTSDDYAHAWFNLPCQFPIGQGEYIARLSSDSYTYLSSSFLGWVQDWEGFSRPEITPQALERPNGIRIITYDDPNT